MRRDGAATHCSDLGGLEQLLRLHDARFVVRYRPRTNPNPTPNPNPSPKPNPNPNQARYRPRMLHWGEADDREAEAEAAGWPQLRRAVGEVGAAGVTGATGATGAANETGAAAVARSFCELDLSEAATWDALRRAGERHGYRCPLPAAAAAAAASPPLEDSSAEEPPPPQQQLHASAAGEAGAAGAGWAQAGRGRFVERLCRPRCDWLAKATCLAHDAPCTVPMQSEQQAARVWAAAAAAAATAAAAAAGAGATRLAACASESLSPPSQPDSVAPRVLYTLLGNPFAGERCCYSASSRPRGAVPERRTLQLHLEVLALLPLPLTPPRTLPRTLPLPLPRTLTLTLTTSRSSRCCPPRSHGCSCCCRTRLCLRE